MSVSKMDCWMVERMDEAGHSVEEIAYAMECSEKTVGRILAGKGPTKQNAIADRMEYFIGGAVPNSGNYLNGELIASESDPTAEEADWERFVEKF